MVSKPWRRQQKFRAPLMPSSCSSFPICWETRLGGFARETRAARMGHGRCSFQHLSTLSVGSTPRGQFLGHPKESVRTGVSILTKGTDEAKKACNNRYLAWWRNGRRDGLKIHCP